MKIEDISDLKRQWLEWAIEAYSIKQYNGCWLWTRTKNENGYGGIRVNRGMQFAHRISYLLFVGPIPDGMCVCHSCDNPSCVNPKHIWLGTRKQNSEDMVRKGRVCRTNRGGGFKPGHTLSKVARVRKLTHQQVIEIRNSDWKLKHLSDKYGVSMATISCIRRGKRKQLVL